MPVPVKVLVATTPVAVVELIKPVDKAERACSLSKSELGVWVINVASLGPIPPAGTSIATIDEASVFLAQSWSAARYGKIKSVASVTFR